MRQIFFWEMSVLAINLYGDRSIATPTGHGIDVSSQRADDLDLMAVAHVKALLLERASASAMDVGCGHGGQAARLAKAGAQVVAVDAVDYRLEVAESMAREGIRPGHFSFYRFPVESGPDLIGVDRGVFDVIMCQRMIHYLKHNEAQAALGWFYRSVNNGGHLFLSASGIASELSEGYAGKELPLEKRFSPLAPAMAEKHSIRPPVCLYSVDELSDAVSAAGWLVEKAFLSPFGNVKLVARKP